MLQYKRNSRDIANLKSTIKRDPITIFWPTYLLDNNHWS